MSAHEGSAQQARDEDYRASVPVGRRRRSGEAPGDPEFYETEITALRADNERLTGWLVELLGNEAVRYALRHVVLNGELVNWWEARKAEAEDRTASLAQEARALLTAEQYEALMSSPDPAASEGGG